MIIVWRKKWGRLYLYISAPSNAVISRINPLHFTSLPHELSFAQSLKSNHCDMMHTPRELLPGMSTNVLILAWREGWVVDSVWEVGQSADSRAIVLSEGWIIFMIQRTECRG